jgi:hypothetical protein
MTKRTAKFIRDLDDFRGHAALYKLSTPLIHEGYDDVQTNHSYVVVSSAHVPFSGPETYIFGANKHGEVVNWSELEGSRRGVYSHADVLRKAGYEVVE